MRCGKPPRRGRRAEDEQARRDAIVGLKRIFKEAGLDFKEYDGQYHDLDHRT